MLHYDQSAKVYDNRYYEEQEAKIEAALSGFTLEKENMILDMGCGTGLLFPYVTSRVKLVVGIDISASIVKQAKKRMKTYTNTALIRADADYAPFPNETFDTVFAITLLQNTPKQSRTINEMKRLTKQKATIVVTGLKKAFSRKEFTRLLREAELKIKALRLDEKLKDYVSICVKSRRKP
jgi:ubiquinone/menaquinone biosynthesis C-methylase UbiE